MGIWSWLFPSDEDRLARARDRMAAGRFADARKILVDCHHPEAEKLYDACCAALEKEERADFKKQMKAEGFHGWQVEVGVKNPKLKAELERLVLEELEKGGVDLGMPEIDQKALQGAVTRAQRRVKGGRGEMGAVRLVPVVDGKLARQIAAQQAAEKGEPRG